MYWVRSRKKFIIGGILGVFLILFTVSWFMSRDAEARYQRLLSVVMYDRNHVPIVVKENVKGHYAIPTEEVPPDFTNLLLKKEDQHFYAHPGLNPGSIARALYRKILYGKTGGSSTITEQLAKNLLQTENERTLTHKLQELFFALSMEVWMSKDTILTMYVNSVFLGNQIQGFETASRAYFNKHLRETTPYEQVVLLATLSYPTSRNPWEKENEPYAEALYKRLVGTGSFVKPPILSSFSLQDESSFELNSLGITCITSCTTSIDTTLTKTIRTFLKNTIDHEYERGVRNGAIVIIDPRTETVLAVVGSPDPSKDSDGGKINMALAPRPIGSTIKPFIYLEGFSAGLRPYTRVDDREYKYPIATGFPLYPKNFDGKYHGEVTLHQALANSLNVPSIKILEYVGLPRFYEFLTEKLMFHPLQPLESYQYGIALGGLEMDLLTLTHYLTIFPRYGTIAPLRVVYSSNTPYTPPQSSIDHEIRVADKAYTELVTKILKDRLTGVEQFGLKSSLNLTLGEYALKTGTSRDFHDSWIIGYTPDIAVGVWVGNSENTALKQVSGQSGAGTVWHDVMEYLIATHYIDPENAFDETSVVPFTLETGTEWGLENDIVSEHQSLLTNNRLIESIHEGDTFALTAHTNIPLRSSSVATWIVNGKEIGTGDSQTFTPTKTGNYEVEARSGDRREIITITITQPE